ncbi:unnamed protein product, partial [Closterium sp. NIES-53]
GCSVLQLPTIIDSLASTACPTSNETATMSVVGGRTRGMGGKTWGKGGGGDGGGGGGGVMAALVRQRMQYGGGTGPAGPTGGGAGPVDWYTAIHSLHLSSSLFISLHLFSSLFISSSLHLFSFRCCSNTTFPAICLSSTSSRSHPLCPSGGGH